MRSVPRIDKCSALDVLQGARCFDPNLFDCYDLQPFHQFGIFKYKQ